MPLNNKPDKKKKSRNISSESEKYYRIKESEDDFPELDDEIGDMGV